MDEAMLHLRDRPRQQFVERTGRSKIEVGELAPEVVGVERGSDRPFSYAIVGLDQFARQEVVPTLAL